MGTQVVIKANKDVPSDSLQNPSDPDAGYSGHKGKGFQMQVMEIYSENKRQPNGKNGGTKIYFGKAICDTCRHQSECPVKRDSFHPETPDEKQSVSCPENGDFFFWQGNREK